MVFNKVANLAVSCRDARVENVKQYFLASNPLCSYRTQLLQVIRDRVAFTANGKRQI